MIQQKNFFIVLPIFLLILACSTTFKSSKLGESGYFDTDTKIHRDDILVNESFSPEYKKMLYVKTDKENVQLNNFFMESFKNMNQFDTVFIKDDLEAFVVEKGLSDKIPDVSNKIVLHNLQKEIGTFLVVEPYYERISEYNYIGYLKAINPETGKEVIVLKNKAYNLTGLDKPLFYPLFNAFLDWVRGDDIKAVPFYYKTSAN